MKPAASHLYKSWVTPLKGAKEATKFLKSQPLDIWGVSSHTLIGVNDTSAADTLTVGSNASTCHIIEAF